MREEEIKMPKTTAEGVDICYVEPRDTLFNPDTEEYSVVTRVNYGNSRLEVRYVDGRKEVISPHTVEALAEDVLPQNPQPTTPTRRGYVPFSVDGVVLGEMRLADALHSMRANYREAIFAEKDRVMKDVRKYNQIIPQSLDEEVRSVVKGAGKAITRTRKAIRTTRDFLDGSVAAGD